MKIAITLTVLLGISGYARAEGVACEDLAKVPIAHGEVTSATLVAAGAFVAPPGGFGAPPPPAANAKAPGGPPGGAPPQGGGGPGGNDANAYKSAPSFCRVKATLRPSADSDIKIEVWMPAAGWNGRLQALGNGAFMSSMFYSQMAEGIAHGYATTSSNTGHEGDDGASIIGHPEKLKDWGYRAVHEMTVAAKALLAAHYGSGPKYSYWNACSTGGRQGLVAAEYYPNDFDGLAVGDPANPMTRLQAGSLWSNRAVNQSPESFITNEKWQLIHRAVMAECDARDGLKDDLIQDPRACNFDLKTLECKGADAPDCLTAPQLEALRKIIGGLKNSKTGEQMYPGWPLGTVMYPGPVAGPTPDRSVQGIFSTLFQDANWDYHTMDLDKDLARADKLGNNVVNAVDEKRLQALFAHGGKLLMYHGWNDPAITPLISIQYYENAVKANGGVGKTYDSIRLFMVPGMNHCGGGDGPNSFDKMGVLTDWVEHGKAPDQILASHSSNGQVDRTRPLCPYPQLAKYKGSGSIDEAQNFSCAAP